MPIIGLNLGKSGFKAVEIDKKKNTYTLTHFGIYDSPELDLYTEKKEERKAYSKALENFVNEQGFDSRNAVIGLEEANVYMRIVELPVMKDKELRNAIRFEAEQYIPLPLEEVNITYQKLEGGYISRDKTSIQLVAAKKSILDMYVKTIKSARLVAKAIEPEAVALGRILGDTSTVPNGTIIMDIGYYSTIVVVVYGGAVQFTRSVPVGGDVITKAIKQSLNLDVNQSEEYKKVYGMDSQYADGKVSEIIKPMIDNILIEVKRASVFFTNHTPSATIKKVVITGGSALMPGLLLYIASNLDFEVQTATPFHNIQISPQLENEKKFLYEREPLFSTAVGLAMKEL
ncbi:type IV pilus assembly protein PilM [Patescibacteria group bacterium]|nr:type IV pilus assembly protein PilM [Patescibacteria group bacterium]